MTLIRTGMLTLNEYSINCGVSVKELKSRRRFAEVVAARQVWWYYLSRCGFGISEIGRMTGWDHSTVFSGIKRVCGLIEAKDRYVARFLDAANLVENNKVGNDFKDNNL